MIVPSRRVKIHLFCFENIIRDSTHMVVIPREAEIKTDRARVDIVKLCDRMCVVVGKTVPLGGISRMDMSSVILHSLIGPRLVLLPC